MTLSRLPRLALLTTALALLTACACGGDPPPDDDLATERPSTEPERPAAPSEPPPSATEHAPNDHGARSGQLAEGAPPPPGDHAPPPTGGACARQHPGHHPPDQPGGASGDTPTQIAAKCPSGASCDASRFITEPHARCVAQRKGLKPGTKPWDVALMFDASSGRPVWSLQNTEGEGTVTLGDGSKADSIYGYFMRIDAITAAVVSEEPWSVAF